MRSHSSHERHRSRFFDLALDMLCVANFDGYFIQVNPAFEKILGWTGEDLVARPFLEFVHPDDRESTLDAMDRLVEGSLVISFENRYLCKNGSYKWISWNSYPVLKESLIYAVARDVTDHRMLEDELRKSEQAYRALFDNAGDAIFLVDRDGHIIQVNQVACDRLGFSREELQKKTIADINSEENAPLVPERLDRMTRDRHLVLETIHVRADGTRIPVEISAELIEHEGRSAILDIARDITKRKQAEEALAAERERLAVTLQSIGDGVISTDIEGRVTLMNEVAEHLTGWEEEESLGKPIDEVFNIINEKTREGCVSPVEKVMSSGRIVGLADHTVLISRDGTERRIGDSGAPIKDPEGKTIGVVLVFRDTTVENKLQEEMARTKRLESVGSLAGGIAHDFNNILTVIEGNITIAKLHVDLDSDVSEYLDNMVKASNRAKTLTAKLLTFAEGGGPVRKPSDLRKLVPETVGFALSGSNVDYSVSSGQDLWFAEIDEGQFSQAIANIVANAKEAMPGGGRVEVRVENDILEEGRAVALPEGKYVRIDVIDHGIGIPKEDLKRVFEPFFTTKPKHEGLGLAVAFSIVKKHAGGIDVEAEVGKGSKFRIFLPALETVPSLPPTIEPESITGNGRVLWMDDDEMIREIGGEMLSHLGYAAEFAEHGETALSMYLNALSEEKPYDAVILDLTVPGGMGGKETISRLLEIDRNVRAIVCSGYSNDPVMADSKDFGFAGVLPKPFGMMELGNILSSMLYGKNEITPPSNGSGTSRRPGSEAIEI